MNENPYYVSHEVKFNLQKSTTRATYTFAQVKLNPEKTKMTKTWNIKMHHTSAKKKQIDAVNNNQTLQNEMQNLKQKTKHVTKNLNVKNDINL